MALNIWVLENLEHRGEQNTRLAIAECLAKKVDGSFSNITEAEKSATVDDLIAQHKQPDVIVLPLNASPRDIEIATALKDQYNSHIIHYSVHTQQENMALYDTIIKPDHENLRADRNYNPSTVLTTTGIPTPITKEKLLAAKDYWATKLGAGNKPIYSVILGGGVVSKGIPIPFSVEDARALAHRIKNLIKDKDVFLDVTDSARTSQEMRDVMTEELGDRIHYFHRVATQEENPYLGLLALSDVIIATADSRSMLCDAFLTASIPELGEKAVLCYSPDPNTCHEDPVSIVSPESFRLLTEFYKKGCFKYLMDDTNVDGLVTKGFNSSDFLAETLAERLSDSGITSDKSAGKSPRR